MTGTVKGNRLGLPKSASKSESKLKRNTGPLFMRSGKLLLTSWFDKKLVNVLSTTGTRGTVVLERRSRKFVGGKMNKAIPKVVHDYNHYMSGFDIYDKKWKYEAYPHKSQNWTECIFHLCKEVALLNAHILWESATGKQLQSREFRLQIAEQLIGEIKPELPLCLQETTGPCHDAMLVPSEPDVITGRKSQHMCVICHRYKGIIKRVTLVCSQCKKPFCNISTTKEYTCYQRHLLHNM